MRTPSRRRPPNRYSPDSSPKFRKTPGANRHGDQSSTPPAIPFNLDNSDFPLLSTPLAQSTQQQNQDDFDATFLRISTVNNGVSSDQSQHVEPPPPSVLPTPAQKSFVADIQSAESPPATSTSTRDQNNNLPPKTFSRGDFVIW